MSQKSYRTTMNRLGQPKNTSGLTLPAEGLMAFEMMIDPKNAS